MFSHRFHHFLFLWARFPSALSSLLFPAGSFRFSIMSITETWMWGAHNTLYRVFTPILSDLFIRISFTSRSQLDRIAKLVLGFIFHPVLEYLKPFHDSNSKFIIIDFEEYQSRKYPAKKWINFYLVFVVVNAFKFPEDSLFSFFKWKREIQVFPQLIKRCLTEIPVHTFVYNIILKEIKVVFFLILLKLVLNWTYLMRIRPAK